MLRPKHARTVGRLLPLWHGPDLPWFHVAFSGDHGLLLPNGSNPLPTSVLSRFLHGNQGETGESGKDDHRGGHSVLY